MDYPFDRLVIANQLIRDQQTTIIFRHLGFSLMSRWQARIGDLDWRVLARRKITSRRPIRSLFRSEAGRPRRPPAVGEVAQIRGHLTAQPRYTVGGLQPDALGKLVLSLQPIDGGHRVRNQGQQLSPLDERGLNVRDARRGLWHALTMPPFTSRLLWCFVGFCGD